MKKHIKLYTTLAILTLFGCKKDFLKEVPPSSLAPVTIKDALGFEASLIGMYNHLSSYFTYSGDQGWLSVWQVGTDVANATANEQQIEIPYYDYTRLVKDDRAAGIIWGKDYVMVKLANTVLDGLDDPAAKVTDAQKASFSAEAKFFRAYAYNSLATLFGGVPLITHAVSGPKMDFTRAPLSEVNKLIEDDLLFAVANLPDVTAAKPGRANKYMAMQLLAEVYLRTGKPDLAAAQAEGVISSGKFSLIKSRYGVKTSLPGDYYADMFVYGNQRRKQGNTEAIWVLEQENPKVLPDGHTDNAQHRRVWVPQYYDLKETGNTVGGLSLADSLGGRGLGRLRLSNWVIYGLYDAKDIRNSKYNIRRQFYYNNPAPAYAAIYGKKVPYTAAEYTALFGSQVQHPFTGVDTLWRICPHTTKWGYFDPNDTFGYATTKDFILMRLGETYLLLAEAKFKMGDLQGAADAINELRKRAFANYPLEGKVEASQMTLDFILDERARELIGEENRRMTLMRTGTLVERAIRLNSGDRQKPIKGLTATNLLLPIPLSEIQLNKDAELKQNPGYE